MEQKEGDSMSELMKYDTRQILEARRSIQAHLLKLDRQAAWCWISMVAIGIALAIVAVAV